MTILFIIVGGIKFPFVGQIKTKTGLRGSLCLFPPFCLLSLHILRPALCVFPLFLPQDTVNALSYLLGFGQRLFPLVPEINTRLFDVLFQSGKPPFNGFQFSLNIQLPAYHGLKFFIKPRHIPYLVLLQEVQHFRRVL